ncbi:MAG TPA: DUF5930 domain-containing protein, partial [Croceicoccus sp.]|nr:DUF5930 domain-containing protein [Croceicoccus sp.]
MKKVASGFSARLQNWFPDREFIMRSQGQVRFVRISGKLQKRLAGAVAALTLVWTGTMAAALANEVMQHQNAEDLSFRE